MHPDLAPAHDAPRLLSPENSADQQHNFNVTSDRPGRITFENRDAVLVSFIREVRLLQIFLQPLSFWVLHLLLEHLDDKQLPANKIISSISLGFARKTTRKCKGHISRAIVELIDAGIIKSRSHGNWAKAAVFELELPPERTHSCAGALGLSAPVREVLARQRARSQRTGALRVVAPAQLSNRTTEVFGGGVNTIYTPPPSGDGFEWTEGLRDMVVGELRKWGIQDRKIRGNNAASIEELLGLPTSSPLIVVSAICGARNRPEKHQPGYVITKIRQPDSIPETIIARGRAKLLALIPPPAASTEAANADPDSELTAEQLAGLREKIAEVRRAETPE